MSSRARRTSLFSQNIANVAYREKLKEQINALIEAVDEKSSVSCLLETEVPKCTDISQLPEARQEFLRSLPDVDAYKEEMNTFLAKYSILQKEMEEIQEKLNTVPLRML